jgi:hypothetical protein
MKLKSKRSAKREKRKKELKSKLRWACGIGCVVFFAGI